MLTNKFTGILLRFRQEQIGLKCDIQGIFHQIRVNPEHRELLRFLWWDGNNLSKNPTDYCMTIHLFGATSSPSCAKFALKKNVDDYEEEFGKQAANFIRHSTSSRMSSRYVVRAVSTRTSSFQTGKK